MTKSRAIDRPAKGPKYQADMFPLKVAYMGQMGSLQHLPPTGPQVAVGPKGVPYDTKYMFYQGIPTMIYNSEHKKYYKTEIEKAGGPWALMTKKPEGWVVKQGQGFIGIEPVAMTDFCPKCRVPRANFGQEGPTGDVKFRNHVAGHYKYPADPEQLEALRKEIEREKKDLKKKSKRSRKGKNKKKGE